MSNQLLNQKEAAAFLNISPRALETWRQLSKGPKFIRLSGRAVRYRPEDLDKYVQEREVRAEHGEVVK